ncbi:MAG: DUF1566 domain-containing protein [Pseudomonadota bacterium]
MKTGFFKTIFFILLTALVLIALAGPFPIGSKISGWIGSSFRSGKATMEEAAYYQVRDRVSQAVRFQIPLPSSPQQSGRPEPASPSRSLHQGVKGAPATLIIRDITFLKAQIGKEIVFIHANDAFDPILFTLEGDASHGEGLRLIMDIPNTDMVRKDLSNINVNGKWIKRIRSHLHQGLHKFRVVLDLEPSTRAYKAKKDFQNRENLFVLEITGEEAPGDRMIANKASPEPKPIVPMEPKRPETVPAAIKARHPVLIEAISFRKTLHGGETVLIRSNRFFKPELTALEGNTPRMVVDIEDSSDITTGPPRIDTDGRMIKRIRSHFDKDSHKLRIVLDLEPSLNYVANQIYFKKENIYALTLTEEGKNNDLFMENPEEIVRASYFEDKGRKDGGETSQEKTLVAGIDDNPALPLQNEIKEIRLRTLGKDLNEKDVLAMLRQYNFYSTCGVYNGDYCNPDGEFHNQFRDNGDGTVTDLATGLMWQKSGSADTITWKEAQDYIKELNRQALAGHSDWRLPTLEELASLMESAWQNEDLFIQAVFDKGQNVCWSSDTHGARNIWKANFNLGFIIDAPATYKNSVRAVRSRGGKGAFS